MLGAAAIREASSLASLALYGSPICKPKLKTQISTPTSNSKRESLSHNSDEVSKDRNRNELLYSKDEEEPNDKIDKIMERKMKERKEKEAKSEKERTPKAKMKQDESKRSNKKDKKEIGSPRPLDISVNTPSSSSRKQGSKVSESNRKRKTNGEIKNGSKRSKKQNAAKPFAQLLEGVTLVISGIQNPDRSNLRAQALSMGAKYKSDWDNTCTHLMYVQKPLEI